MFLKRAILINWGNIPQIELEFGPVNLFSGGNGSGKTTAADAIMRRFAEHRRVNVRTTGQQHAVKALGVPGERNGVAEPRGHPHGVTPHRAEHPPQFMSDEAHVFDDEDVQAGKFRFKRL